MKDKIFNAYIGISQNKTIILRVASKDEAEYFYHRRDTIDLILATWALSANVKASHWVIEYPVARYLPYSPAIPLNYE